MADRATGTETGPLAGRVRSLVLIGAAEVAALSLWFSATAIVPSLRLDADLSPLLASLFTSAVQVGFVIGTLVSALLGLADRFDARRLFAGSALFAALANGLILVVDPAGWSVVPLRFATGMAMAGIYPVGMKLAIGWARGDMGLLVGSLVGALTLGSAMPHLFNALGGVDWRLTIGLSSCAAGLAAGLIGLARSGPNERRAAGLDWRRAGDGWRNPALRLANLGYLGHMWELYAMWAWIGLFLDASFRLSMADPESAARWAAAATFAVVGVGAVGSVLAGLFADRAGRTTVTIVAMATSGSCALLIGPLFGAEPWLLMVVALVWGISVIADSAQFSAAIAELSPPDAVGTMLTAQTGVGFLLTLVTIHLVPWIAAEADWFWAFMPLAAGPALGVLAMAALRRRPEARFLAGGRG